MIPFERAFGGLHKRIVLVTGAQSGKTDAFLDIIGHRADQRPVPILYAGPNKDFNTDQFEPRLSDLFRQAPRLGAKLVGGIDSKKQKKTLKRVAGITIRLAHAGSSTALKSDPAGLALVDEYDEMLANIRGQGDPLGLIEARGITYADFQTGIASTPSQGVVDIVTDEESGLELWSVTDPDDVASPIWRLWQEGTRHHWCWPCLHCGKYFVPRFKQLDWPKNSTPAQARRDASVGCPRCGGVHLEADKAELNRRGVYAAPGQTITAEGVVQGDAPETSTLSFWVSGLASPFISFGERAQAYLMALASGERDKVQTAINAGFGEVYTPGGADVPEWIEVLQHRLPYAARTMPAEALFLTCGVDVQANRLPYVIRAWGPGVASWLVDYGEIWGDTSELEVWHELDAVVDGEIEGVPIRLTFVDSGFRPGKKFSVPEHRVYDFARRHTRNVRASKGSSVALVRPIVSSKIEIKGSGKASTFGIDLVRLSSDHWKSFVHERLRYPMDGRGAWFLHQDAGEDYARQIVSEARIRTPAGKVQWVQLARDNHFLDCEALASAAANLLGVQRLPTGPETYHRPAEAPAPEPPPEPVVVRGPLDDFNRPPVRKDSWLGDRTQGWNRR